ncbi:MAG: tetratricopeptide repeat protein, partial [Sandaracinaceae bacterium]
AMEASSQSVRLDGRSPSGRAVRGAILLVAGQADQGLQELLSAKQLRSDAPRRNLLAGVHMAQGDLDAASREIAAALEEYPDFAPGRATLAAIHLSRGETDMARAELEYAERADPQLHLLPQLWAGYYASTGDLERAVERAEAAVEANPDLQTRLMAARIYRQAAQYDRMRREARAVLAQTPSQREPEIRNLIRQMLGPTALEDPDEEIELDDEALAEGEADEGLGLGDPSSLQLDSPSLGAGGDDGPSLLGGGDDDLQLGGGGGGLQLGGGGGGGLQLGGGGGGNYRLNLGN